MSSDDRWPSQAVSEKLDCVTADIAAFYEKEMPRLVLFVKALNSGLDMYAAADVAQTAFERALPRWAGLRHPKAWLYRVAQNEALARGAAIQREVPTQAVPEQPDQMSAALAAEWRAEQRDVMAFLQTLAPKQRLVMSWTLAGFSDAEIGRALDITTDAVKKNRQYAKQNLRKQLEARRDVP